MILKGISKTWVAVDIPKSELLQAFSIMVHQSLKLPIDCDTSYGIRDGSVVQFTEVGGGSHSWTETKIIREATSEDKTLLNALKLLEREYKHGGK